MAYSSNYTNAHLATGVCVVVSPGRCNDKRRGVVDEEGEEDAHEQGGQFHHPPHILLPLSPSLHCAAFRGALAVGRPLWPQLLATPAHEADCTRRQRVKLASKLYQRSVSDTWIAVTGGAVNRLIWGFREHRRSQHICPTFLPFKCTSIQSTYTSPVSGLETIHTSVRK